MVATQPGGRSFPEHLELPRELIDNYERRIEEEIQQLTGTTTPLDQDARQRVVNLALSIAEHIPPKEFEEIERVALQLEGEMQRVARSADFNQLVSDLNRGHVPSRLPMASSSRAPELADRLRVLLAPHLAKILADERIRGKLAGTQATTGGDIGTLVGNEIPAVRNRASRTRMGTYKGLGLVANLISAWTTWELFFRIGAAGTSLTKFNPVTEEQAIWHASLVLAMASAGVLFRFNDRAIEFIRQNGGGVFKALLKVAGGGVRGAAFTTMLAVSLFANLSWGLNVKSQGAKSKRQQAAVGIQMNEEGRKMLEDFEKAAQGVNTSTQAQSETIKRREAGGQSNAGAGEKTIFHSKEDLLDNTGEWGTPPYADPTRQAQLDAVRKGSAASILSDNKSIMDEVEGLGAKYKQQLQRELAKIKAEANRILGSSGTDELKEELINQLVARMEALLDANNPVSPLKQYYDEITALFGRYNTPLEKLNEINLQPGEALDKLNFNTPKVPPRTLQITYPNVPGESWGTTIKKFLFPPDGNVSIANLSWINSGEAGGFGIAAAAIDLLAALCLASLALRRLILSDAHWVPGRRKTTTEQLENQVVLAIRDTLNSPPYIDVLTPDSLPSGFIRRSVREVVEGIEQRLQSDNDLMARARRLYDQITGGTEATEYNTHRLAWLLFISDPSHYRDVIETITPALAEHSVNRRAVRSAIQTSLLEAEDEQAERGELHSDMNAKDMEINTLLLRRARLVLNRTDYLRLVELSCIVHPDFPQPDERGTIARVFRRRITTAHLPGAAAVEHQREFDRLLKRADDEAQRVGGRPGEKIRFLTSQIEARTAERQSLELLQIHRQEPTYDIRVQPSLAASYNQTTRVPFAININQGEEFKIVRLDITHTHPDTEVQGRTVTTQSFPIAHDDKNLNPQFTDQFIVLEGKNEYSLTLRGNNGKMKTHLFSTNCDTPALRQKRGRERIEAFEGLLVTPFFDAIRAKNDILRRAVYGYRAGRYESPLSAVQAIPFLQAQQQVLERLFTASESMVSVLPQSYLTLFRASVEAEYKNIGELLRDLKAHDRDPVSAANFKLYHTLPATANWLSWAQDVANSTGIAYTPPVVETSDITLDLDSETRVSLGKKNTVEKHILPFQFNVCGLRELQVRVESVEPPFLEGAQVSLPIGEDRTTLYGPVAIPKPFSQSSIRVKGPLLDGISLHNGQNRIIVTGVDIFGQQQTCLDEIVDYVHPESGIVEARTERDAHLADVAAETQRKDIELRQIEEAQAQARAQEADKTMRRSSLETLLAESFWLPFLDYQRKYEATDTYMRGLLAGGTITGRTVESTLGALRATPLPIPADNLVKAALSIEEQSTLYAIFDSVGQKVTAFDSLLVELATTASDPNIKGPEKVQTLGEKVRVAFDPESGLSLTPEISMFQTIAPEELLPASWRALKSAPAVEAATKKKSGHKSDASHRHIPK